MNSIGSRSMVAYDCAGGKTRAMALGRKQKCHHEAFVWALAHAMELVPLDHLERLAERTTEEIMAVTAGKQGAFAWSGGKDSQVLRWLCEQVGIVECTLVITDLEYPGFLRWVTDQMPWGLEVVNTGQDLEWLARHPEMLFPQDARTAARWFHLVQHTGLARYCRGRGMEVLLLGRRRRDGNHVGPDGRYWKEGVLYYSPLRDWTHEEVLAFVKLHRVPLPPCYGWPRGFRVGTGPWPARQWTGSIRQGWREVYAIDPSIVHDAARLIPSAAELLREEVG